MVLKKLTLLELKQENKTLRLCIDKLLDDSEPPAIKSTRWTPTPDRFKQWRKEQARIARVKARAPPTVIPHQKQPVILQSKQSELAQVRFELERATTLLDQLEQENEKYFNRYGKI
jgi:hypothetical protein